MVTAWGSDLLVGPTRSLSQRQLARWVLRRADYVTCVSNDLAQAALALGADPERLEVAHWGIDTTVFQPGAPSASLRKKLGLGPGPVVLSIRPVLEKYNPLDVALAIPRVVEKVPSAQFIIRTYAAEPALLSEFRKIVQNASAEESVHYLGDLPDDQAIADLYRLSDIAISVPPSDGTPLSVLEAMASGVVLVLSDLPSLRDWVTDGVEGVLVPVGDPESISSATSRLLTDHELRKRMAESSISLIRKRADRKIWMRRSEEIYLRLMGQTADRG
jgi:glycosyltransferase involved in cell wall biosynthesis